LKSRNRTVSKRVLSWACDSMRFPILSDILSLKIWYCRR